MERHRAGHGSLMSHVEMWLVPGVACMDGHLLLLDSLWDCQSGASYTEILDWGFSDNVSGVHLLIRPTETWYMVMNSQHRLFFLFSSSSPGQDD